MCSLSSYGQLAGCLSTRAHCEFRRDDLIGFWVAAPWQEDMSSALDSSGNLWTQSCGKQQMPWMMAVGDNVVTQQSFEITQQRLRMDQVMPCSCLSIQLAELHLCAG